MTLNKPITASASIPITVVESRREALITARDQIRLQLNGVENQIYILDQLLEPESQSEPGLPPGTI